MNNLLLFDFNNLLMKAISATPDLEFNGKHTGGLYGFLNQICKYINDFEPKKIIVCSDLPPYFRKKEYPQYKANRKPQTPERYELIQTSRKYCKELLEVLGIAFWELEGMEADDLIAIAVDEYTTEFDSIIAVSNDDDLFQLFKYPNFKLQKNKEIWTRKTFESMYPVSIQDWLTVKALSGSHNGVPGIKGIGLKTALKIVQDDQKLDNIQKQHGKEIDQYERLIYLPYIPFDSKKCTSELWDEVKKLKQIIPKRNNERAFMHFLNQFNILYTPNMKKAFQIIGGHNV